MNNLNKVLEMFSKDEKEAVLGIFHQKYDQLRELQNNKLADGDVSSYNEAEVLVKNLQQTMGPITKSLQFELLGIEEVVTPNGAINLQEVVTPDNKMYLTQNADLTQNTKGEINMDNLNIKEKVELSQRLEEKLEQVIETQQDSLSKWDMESYGKAKEDEVEILEALQSLKRPVCL